MIALSTFNAALVEKLQQNMLLGGESAEIHLQEIQKLNESYTGLIILQNGQQVSAAIRLDPYYEQFQKGRSLQEICREIQRLHQSLSCPLDAESLSEIIDSYEKIRTLLFIRISSYDKNKELSRRIPHRKVYDMMISCHINLGIFSGQRASILVTHDMLKGWKKTAACLLRDAVGNSQKKMPLSIRPLREMINCTPGEMHGCSNADLPLYVVRSEGAESAAALFYPGTLEKLCQIAGGDYYILPSSINEVLMLPSSDSLEASSLQKMVKEINQTNVKETERLSDNIYYYDAALKELQMLEF